METTVAEACGNRPAGARVSCARWSCSASPLDELMAEARAVRERAARAARHLQPEGLHPADEALPGRLPLLHVRPPAAARRARVHDDRRGARRSRARASGPAAARRSSRSATSPSCATGRRATSWPRSGADSTVEYLAHAAAGRARGDVAPAAPQPGRAHRGRLRAAPAGRGLDGADARDDLGAALGARRPALRLARQAAGGAARDAAPRRRGARAVHDRDPDRDRRDARGAARRAARDRRRRARTCRR